MSEVGSNTRQQTKQQFKNASAATFVCGVIVCLNAAFAASPRKCH